MFINTGISMEKNETLKRSSQVYLSQLKSTGLFQVKKDYSVQDRQMWLIEYMVLGIQEDSS